MKRVQKLGRVTLVGAAAAALLLGGVSPAFAEQDDAGVSEVEVSQLGQPEEGLEAPVEEASGEETPEVVSSGELNDAAEESADEIVEIPFSAATEPVPGVDEALPAATNIFSGPRRKVSGTIKLPAGAPKSWLKQVGAGADCSSWNAGGGCGYDVKINTTTGAFTMMVPVVQSGWTITVGAYASNPNGKTTANLVQQYWGATCGVGTPKPLSAGKGELKNVTLSMCLGETISGEVSDPDLLVEGTGYFGGVAAYVGGGVTQQKAYASIESGGKYTLERVPRVGNVSVVFDGHGDVSDQIWNAPYDVKRATPVDTTRGAVTGVNFSVKPGFSDMCIQWAFCNKFYKEVMWMRDEGISTGTKVTEWGTTSTRFKPKENVSREAMSAFLYRISDRTGYKPSKTPRFADVKPGHKFYKQIQWMGDTGISTGTKRNGKVYYDPSQGVSREAMSAFLYRIADREGYVPTSAARFVDVKKSHKFYKQIQWMGDEGISTGTKKNGASYYDPSQKVSREAMSAFLYRFKN